MIVRAVTESNFDFSFFDYANDYKDTKIYLMGCIIRGRNRYSRKQLMEQLDKLITGYITYKLQIHNIGSF